MQCCVQQQSNQCCEAQQQKCTSSHLWLFLVSHVKELVLDCGQWGSMPEVPDWCADHYSLGCPGLGCRAQSVGLLCH